jgi:hypothetical protein
MFYRLSPTNGILDGNFHPLRIYKFYGYFVFDNYINNLISGEKAKEFFMRSKLSVEKLSQIWYLF